MKHITILCITTLFLIISCTEPQPIDIIKLETIIINKSNSDIKYIAYGYIDSIDTLHILKNEIAIEIHFNRRFPENADSVQILFNDEKQIVYKPYIEDKRERNVFLIDAYNKEKISSVYYRFTYTFTEEDYNNAIPLQ